MRTITLGICCMEEKLKCRSMQYFIEQLKNFSNLEIIEFDMKTILESPIGKWPIVDCILSYYSTGFPLEKTIQYCNLRNPYQINDLKIQEMLQDRRFVNQILEMNGIPTPKSISMYRDSQNINISQLVEKEDYIEIDGKRIYKPFIEKPFNSEDHNNYIYYPKSQGGGCRKLFRKIGNNSSEYLKDLNNIRTNGSFIYEEFVKIDDSKDVKVYSTSAFSYAELRKSPSVDGCVERNKCGREKRTVSPLSNQELLISMKISKAFKQFVCGYDILRVNGTSYVCDVNGWSFVKGENFKAFYDNASHLLYNHLVEYFNIDLPTSSIVTSSATISINTNIKVSLPNSSNSSSSSSSPSSPSSPISYITDQLFINGNIPTNAFALT